MKVKKNKKGFTLVEVIVSMIIVSIILTFATSFFFTGERMFENSIKGNTSKLIGDNILEFISERLTYATNVEVLKDSTVPSAKYENVIYLNSEKTIGFNRGSDKRDNLYTTNYYNGYTIKLLVTVMPDNCMKVTIKVMDNNEEQYTSFNVIRLINLNVSNSKIDIDESLISKEIENPIISFSESVNKAT